MNDYEIVVIGGGAAGLSAARAAKRGKRRVLLISEGPLGGDCTFFGCVPSKALLEGAHRGDSFTDAVTFMRKSIAEIASGEDEATLRGEGIEVLRGRATFIDRTSLRVGQEIIRAKRFVIATGAYPNVFPIEGLESIEYLTNESIFDLEELPARTLVIGGGAIGCELALALRGYGSKVTLVEFAPRILPLEEARASAIATEHLIKSSITLRTSTKVVRLEHSQNDGNVAYLEGGERIEFDKLLIATGRRPRTDGLNLEAAGVLLNPNGSAKVDSKLTTSNKSIAAVGDVNGLSPFTHAADEQGRIAIQNLFLPLVKRKFDPDKIPHVTYLEPEVASIGVTETRQRVDQSSKLRVVEFDLTRSDRDIVAKSTDGYIKVIAAPKRFTGFLLGGRIVGATVVSPRAGEIINQISMLVALKTPLARAVFTVFAYPTFSTPLRSALSRFFIKVDGEGWRGFQLQE
ncbi:MAG: NAD(P)/FAD-dependent oxidoreductase [Actinomycetota bacterium]|nr:NAD(P)/FAD-dependent oxidoreductase [Actinomycetota bacterium]